jgi:hypothetical protein
VEFKKLYWWRKSFDWYIVIEIIPGFSYGPFYRIDGDLFWPKIGIPGQDYSENKCFFQLKKPNGLEDAKEMYAPKAEWNDDSRLYKFSFELTQFSIGACMFLGPVAGGTGYQMNPNSSLVEIIRTEIIKGKVEWMNQDKKSFSGAWSKYLLGQDKNEGG